MDTPYPVTNHTITINEHFELEDEDISHPSIYKTTKQYQQKDKNLIKIAHTNKDYSIQNFHEAYKKYSLICINLNIVIHKLLEKQVVEWYHNDLCHFGEIHSKKC